jgi:AcrR family transcriptional regulator
MTADGRAACGESATIGRKSAPVAAGRPRDGRIDAAVIAARAGTTTAAIYRRWSGKAQLVHEAVLPTESIPLPAGSGDVRSDIRSLVETIRSMFDRPEVRVALPGLIADTVADPEVHDQMIARLAGNLTVETHFGRARRGDDQLPMLAEVVAGTVIFRILVRRDAALDEAWVDEMTEMITGSWSGPPAP